MKGPSPDQQKAQVVQRPDLLLPARGLIWRKMDLTSKDNYGVKKNQDRKLLITTSGLHKVMLKQ